MKYNEIFIAIYVLAFYHLANEFIDFSGMKFKLLKLIMEIIMLLFIMILYKYKKEIKNVIYFDTWRRKFDEYITKK